jgi:hypothetical protein
MNFFKDSSPVWVGLALGQNRMRPEPVADATGRPTGFRRRNFSARSPRRESVWKSFLRHPQTTGAGVCMGRAKFVALLQIFFSRKGNELRGAVMDRQPPDGLNPAKRLTFSSFPDQMIKK